VEKVWKKGSETSETSRSLKEKN